MLGLNVRIAKKQRFSDVHAVRDYLIYTCAQNVGLKDLR